MRRYACRTAATVVSKFVCKLFGLYVKWYKSPNVGSVIVAAIA
jgi:hypothetical protein